MIGNRNPSITQTIAINGVAVDLTSKTVQFRMRAVNSTTLRVDQPATIVSAVNGQVRYDWAAADVTGPAGDYLVWWVVTDLASKTEDVMEAVVEFRDHSPQTNTYIELEVFKSTANLKETNFMDGDIQVALRAASRAVDEICQRLPGGFFAATADTTRTYTPHYTGLCYIDDLTTLTSLKTDQSGMGNYTDTWATTDYILEPANAPAEGKPYTYIRVRPGGSFWFMPIYPETVQVVGRFGWASVPPAISEATTILAGRFLKRSREAPFGAAEALALGGAAIHLTGVDPDVSALLTPYMRHPVTHPFSPTFAYI